MSGRILAGGALRACRLLVNLGGATLCGALIKVEAAKRHGEVLWIHGSYEDLRVSVVRRFSDLPPRREIRAPQSVAPP